MIKIALGTILVAGTLMAFTGCNSKRHGWHSNPEKKAAYAVKKISKKLDLEDNQKAALQDVVNSMVAARKEMRQDKQKMHGEILSMIESDNLDQEKILGIVDTKQKLVDDKAPEIVAKLATFHGTLKPEQKEKMAKYFRNHTERYN